jgi:regulator of protease activity HflC (stomatin/prohibitin superfamily)
MPATRKHNAPWTPADLKKMRALAKARLSARLAAKALGRSTGAVKFKAMVEGVRFQFINQPQGVQQRLARRNRRQRRR